MICPDHTGSEWQGGNLHHSPVTPCAPSCSAHHSAPREGLPAPVLRCHPYNVTLWGKGAHAKLNSKEAGETWGIVYAANWDN